MKSSLRIVPVMILAVGIQTLFAVENFSHAYFGVYGEAAAVMGRADGSALEIWVYPYKLVHDLSVMVVSNGNSIDPRKKCTALEFGHHCFTRRSQTESWQIREQIYPDLKHPVAYLVYTVVAHKELELVFSLVPDLTLMWPGAIGGRYSYWDPEGYFVLSEASGSHTALFGPRQGQKQGTLPAHKLPGGKLRFVIRLSPGRHIIPLVAVAGNTDRRSMDDNFRLAFSRHREVLTARKNRIREISESFLEFTCSDPLFTTGYPDALQNLYFAWVNNPALGAGLIAGYGLSGEGERPGFGWYFGGDGLINAYALLHTGDFTRARRELEFLLTYQRPDGKIPHEISQAAAYIPWFQEYGFAYFHGDTTLHFLTFLGTYLNRTADTGFLNIHREKLDLIFNWMKRVDSDNDGIVETPLAGTGASETGPLRQEMQTDIYLAALSASSWETLEEIYQILDQPEKSETAGIRRRRAVRGVNRKFWNSDMGYPAYALQKNGAEGINEVTIWPAVGMRHAVFSQDRGRSIQQKIASPELSTDWGARFLSSQSGYYDPLSYNNGAVWPFLTGYAAMACYRYGNPFHGFNLLKANFHIIRDFVPGRATELLSGRNYIPLDQSVPDQIWSSGNTLTALVEGLLGFESRRKGKKISLSPAIPLYWSAVSVKKLRVFNGFLDLDYRRGEENRFEFLIHMKDLEGSEIDFIPRFPARQINMYLDTGQKKKLPVPLTCEQPDHCLKIVGRLQGYFYPYLRQDPIPGQESCSPIIEDVDIGAEECRVILWGRGSRQLFFCTDQNITSHEVLSTPGGDHVSLEFDEGKWQRRTVIFQFGDPPRPVRREPEDGGK